MSHQGRIRPLLATARIANVPSVASNVWVGIAIGSIVQRWEHGGQPVWLHAVLLILAGVFLYIGGNFLNDWHDRDWDAKNRPERALPAGLFSPATYLLIALLCGAAGLVLALLVSWKCAVVAALIILLIVIYTRWHKKAAWAVIPMGLCRALLPVMGFVGFAVIVRFRLTPEFGLPPPSMFITYHAAALLIYIAGLSLGARHESSPHPSAAALAVSKAALVFSGLLAAALWIFLSVKAGIIGFLPFAVWMLVCLTRYRRPIPVHVSALLAGIPLIDWIALLAYCLLMPPLSYPPAIQPYVIACLIIPPLAFTAGRLLQRLAPAT
ncbi:UbiA family prenyltransferase [Luteolibacter sp. SL250]|uniref:UbiA family prenyltransferase n=1 Tax=Luteolibacter sp. SL250 TaxID=2995170 RepID=UPI002271D59C|nr:UbiA family prenyltransferase [Luteolibacter sp. SL250]WAC17976.1 UbiA family prenyltransferase [Luteolibacter sp. SL250]